MSEAANVLRLENITMQFGGVVAVNNLSLEVNRDEIVALIGPNGAGKTTAFNCVTGVYQPTNGIVEYKGEAIVRAHPTGKMKKIYAGENADMYAAQRPINPTPDQITRMGIARTFQNIRLWKSMTVYENVLTAKHILSKQNFLSATFRWAKAEDRQMKEETLALLEEQDLYKYKDDLAVSLPYGLQRRLEIARALATKPELLLLDEPAAGMNPQETNELGEFIVKTREKYGLSVLMIEHHMDLVMSFSDRIYAIDFGKLICGGTPKTVAADQRVIDAYLGVSDDE